MGKKFAEHSKLNLSDVNKEVLEQWNGEDLFHRSITEREGCPSFVFFEGPPSANGHPGIHHVMGRTIKDTFLRYKTMQGFQVKRKAGWDTHGLPVELSVEKSLGITKEDIGKKISVDDYNDACRKNVMMYTDEWSDLTNKMGYWVDLEHPYITYDNKYIESLWWLLKQLYNKDLLGFCLKTADPVQQSRLVGMAGHTLHHHNFSPDLDRLAEQFDLTYALQQLSAGLREGSLGTVLLFQVLLHRLSDLLPLRGKENGDSIDRVLFSSVIS